MKAFIVERADGPFREIEMAVPVPAPGQVLVKIHASGINPLDTKIRAGSAAHARQPLLAVLGIDVARDITVVRSLEPGLDDKAVSAVQQWKFQPGAKDGQAVDVKATIEVNFRLK